MFNALNFKLSQCLCFGWHYRLRKMRKTHLKLVLMPRLRIKVSFTILSNTRCFVLKQLWTIRKCSFVNKSFLYIVTVSLPLNYKIEDNCRKSLISFHLASVNALEIRIIWKGFSYCFPTQQALNLIQDISLFLMVLYF